MNFVICYTKRSGGNVMMEFLNHQKNLHCHGRIFPDDAILTLKMPETLEEIHIDFNKLMETLKWPAAVRKLKEAQNLTNLFLKEKNRYDNIPGILKILEKTEKKSKVGFLFSLDDYEKTPVSSRVKLFKLFNKENTKLILLDRRNQFEQFVSLQLCERYKRYTRKTLELPKLQKIGIKPAEYLTFKSNQNSLKDKFIQDLIKFNVNFREHFYEDIKDEDTYIETYKSILEFLEEDPLDFVDASNLIIYKKVNIYPPNISVSNYSSVAQFLKSKEDSNFI
jgi:hypothetical protein